MNIDFKNLAKTALVVSVLAGAMSAQSQSLTANIEASTQAVLAACQLADTPFSFHVSNVNRSVANIVHQATGSNEKLATLYQQSGACDVLRAYQQKATQNHSWAEQLDIADTAVSETLDPLVDALQANYSQEMTKLFGAQVPVVPTPADTVATKPQAANYQNEDLGM